MGRRRYHCCPHRCAASQRRLSGQLLHRAPALPIAVFTPNPLGLPVSFLAVGVFLGISFAAWRSRGAAGGRRRRLALVALSCLCALVGVLGLTVEHIPLAWQLTSEPEFIRFHTPDLSAEWPAYASDVAPRMIWSGCASFLAVAIAAARDNRAPGPRAV